MDTIPRKLVADNAKVRERWEAQLRSDGIPADEPYNALGALARVLVDLHSDSSVGLADVFQAVERELVAADASTRNLLIVGFLEDLQNVSLNVGLPLDVWVESLGPMSLASWGILEGMWSGAVSPADLNAFVDATGIPER